MRRGQLRTIVVSLAGNGNQSIAPAAGRRYKLISGFLQIVCDATVADRSLLMQWRDTALAAKVSPLVNGTTVTAGNTGSLVWFPYGTTVGTGAGPAGDARVGLTFPVEWGPGHDLYITVTNGVAGDVVSGRLLVEDIPA